MAELPDDAGAAGVDAGVVGGLDDEPLSLFVSVFVELSLDDEPDDSLLVEVDDPDDEPDFPRLSVL